MTCNIYRLALIAIMTIAIAGCNSLGGKASQQQSDIDGDGVADVLDRCQQTAEGVVVDADGCEIFNGPIEGIAFLPGDHRLNLESRSALDQLITDLNTHPTVKIALGGHTDNRGSAEANLELSKRRVMSVVRYLVAKGIDGSRLEPFGYGESRPVVSNATADGRVRNRRIEISVIAQ